MKLKLKKENRGGKRKGAGRKPKNIKRFTIDVDETTYIQFLSLKKESKKTWNNFILSLVDLINKK